MEPAAIRRCHVRITRVVQVENGPVLILSAWSFLNCNLFLTSGYLTFSVSYSLLCSMRILNCHGLHLSLSFFNLIVCNSCYFWDCVWARGAISIVIKDCDKLFFLCRKSIKSFFVIVLLKFFYDLKTMVYINKIAKLYVPLYRDYSISDIPTWSTQACNGDCQSCNKVCSCKYLAIKSINCLCWFYLACDDERKKINEKLIPTRWGKWSLNSSALNVEPST